MGTAALFEPSFEHIDGTARFSLMFRPPVDIVPRGAVVYVPPFAEEMNKSRRMAASMARALADAGWHVSLPDLFGCGDSEGDFGDATWGIWREDIARRIRQSSVAAPGPLWIWGLRAGCLLAAASLPQDLSSNILLWHPVVRGSIGLNQFLRLRTAGSVIRSGEGAGRKELRARLANGETIEIAGYALNSLLADDFEKAEMELPQGFPGKVVWLELVPEDQAGLSPASQSLTKRWCERGINVHAEAIAGPAFWQAQEIAHSADLISRSVELML